MVERNLAKVEVASSSLVSRSKIRKPDKIDSCPAFLLEGALLNTTSLRWPSGHVLPDYGQGGIYGLARSLRDWLHDPQAGCDAAEVAPGEPARIVLLVIDGLGANFLQTIGAGSALQAHCRRTLTSVFPSTTASAVTTLMTGASPAEHGLNGWFIHDQRFGGVIAPLPLELRGNGPLEAARLTRRLFPQPSMFHGAVRPVVMVSPQEIAFSPYSRHHARGARMHPYGGREELEDGIVDAAMGLGAEGGFVHAYYPRFDAVSHGYGCRSAHAQTCFARIDAMFARLCERLAGSGVRILVTADHGFIDSAPERTVQIAPDSAVSAMLAAPLWGERRLAFCSVRKGAKDEFEHWAAETLEGRAVLMSGADCIESGLFGPGRPNTRLAERAGTHVLLMEPGWTIVDTVEGETPFDLIGVHGGMSADEMRVPLVLARL